MAAPVLVQFRNTDHRDVAVAPALTSAPTAGNLIIACVFSYVTGDGAAINGWTKGPTLENSSDRWTVYYRYAAPGDTATYPTVNANVGFQVCATFEVSGAAGTWAAALAAQQITFAPTALSYTPPALVSTAADQLALSASGRYLVFGSGGPSYGTPWTNRGLITAFAQQMRSASLALPVAGTSVQPTITVTALAAGGRTSNAVTLILKSGTAPPEDITVTPLAGTVTVQGQIPTLKIDTVLSPLVGQINTQGSIPQVIAENNPTYVEALPGELTITGNVPDVWAGAVITTAAPGVIEISGGVPAVYLETGAFVTQHSILTLGRVVPDAQVTQLTSMTLAKVIPDTQASQLAVMTLAKVTPDVKVSQLVTSFLIKPIVQDVMLPEPEDGINETWSWSTDVIVSDDGREQRIALRDVPRRGFSETVNVTDVDLMRKLVRFIAYKSSDGYVLPLYPYMVRPTERLLAGADIIKFDVNRTEVRQGSYLYIHDPVGGFQLCQIVELLADGVRVDLPVLKNYSSRVVVMPGAMVFSAANAVLTRANPDHAGSIGVNVTELQLHTPFVRPGNTEVVPTFDGLPILDMRQVGTSFDDTFDSGIEVQDYDTGPVHLRNTWKNGQNQFQRSFLFQRIWNREQFDRFKVLADEIKGSQKPFLLCSDREDFEIITPAVPGSDRILVDGIKYGPAFFGRNAFRRVRIDTAAGSHYANVWAAARQGEDNLLHFLPPLPVGEGWDQEQKISFLVQLRLVGDRISLEHRSLYTTATMTLRTVDD